jgi:hypothetical protein
MAYMAESTAASFIMFLSIALNLYAILMLQDYFSGAPQQEFFACSITWVSITMSCTFLYKKLSGEQRVRTGFNTMMTMGPGFLAGYAIRYFEGHFQKKAGCRFR